MKLHRILYRHKGSLATDYRYYDADGPIQAFYFQEAAAKKQGDCIEILAVESLNKYTTKWEDVTDSIRKMIEDFNESSNDADETSRPDC